ncbi:helix-turn-helix domain-containing protein [Stenotrophomonas aracearum]|uniref:helix-turn-helix domain-containing protein n=1 Tax=Stenotrophomonas aracearum TaxID=3003272 RepID=UPI003CCDA99E
MHPQQPFLLGICEALGPDAPLRRVVFLMVLWQVEEHGISAGELERRVDAAIGTAQSTTSRTIRVLVRAGLVECYLCSRDRRIRLIRLTGVARVLLRSLAERRPV